MEFSPLAAREFSCQIQSSLTFLIGHFATATRSTLSFSYDGYAVSPEFSGNKDFCSQRFS